MRRLTKGKGTYLDALRAARFIEHCQNTDGGYGSSTGLPPNMESTRFAVNSLRLLEMLPNIDQTVSWVMLHRKSGEGFSNTITSDTELAATYYAVRVLAIAKSSISEEEKCMDWINSHQRVDGGYAYPRNKRCSDIDSTYYAFQSLHLLKRQIPNSSKCVIFLKELKTASGAFSSVIGDIPNMEATYCAVHILELLKRREYDRNKCMKWVLSCQNPEGGFACRPTERPKLSATYWAVHTLILLGSAVPNIGKTIQWIRSCQTFEGGFAVANSKQRKPQMWLTYCAIHALRLLGYYSSVGMRTRSGLLPDE